MIYQTTLLGAVIAFIFALIGGAAFFIKQVTSHPKRKAIEDKALLKELLEGFGLEVPDELQEAKSNVIK